MQKDLREVREKYIKMTQENLAHHLGTTTATYAKKEKYLRPLKAKELIEIARMASLDPREIRIF